MSHLYGQIQRHTKPPVENIRQRLNSSASSKGESTISDLTLEQGLKPPPQMLPTRDRSESDFEIPPDALLKHDPDASGESIEEMIPSEDVTREIQNGGNFSVKSGESSDEVVGATSGGSLLISEETSLINLGGSFTESDDDNQRSVPKSNLDDEQQSPRSKEQGATSNGSQLQTNNRKKWLYLIVLLFLMIVGAIVAVFLIYSRNRSGNESENASNSESGAVPEMPPAPSTPPLPQPTQQPTLSSSISSTTPTDLVLEELASVAFDGGESLIITGSPQNRAASWLASQDIDVQTYDFLQRYALATFYYATGGNVTWTEDDLWLSKEPVCSWNSTVESRCDKNNALVSLSLPINDLSGILPKELAHATALTAIDLSRNELQGTIPVELFTEIPLLKLLILYDNKFNGTIPTQLGLMRNVFYLDLEDNFLTGTIPSEIGALSSVEIVFLRGNGLQGTIPKEISQMIYLRELYLDGNQLSGSVPDEICNLSYLARLYVGCKVLCNCCDDICGLVPVALPSTAPVALPSTNITRVTETIASASFDSGVALSIYGTPQSKAIEWLLNTTGVESLSDERLIQRYALATIYFAVGGPNWSERWGWLSDADECSWYGSEYENEYNVTICTEGQINILDVWNNNATGQLPPELGLLTDLFVLNFYNNSLTGTLPEELGRLTNLELGCDFDSNQLSGPIPTVFGQLTLLTTLWLNNNMFTGQIPSEIALMTSLERLYLSDNPSLFGSVPSQLCALNVSVLQVDCDNLVCGCLACGC